MSKTLGIIGTSGRGNDIASLDLATMGVMKAVAQSFVELLDARHLVSGGAAWADSLAVHLFVSDIAKQLTLYFPCPFNDTDTYLFDGNYATGAALNHYHSVFKQVTGHDSLRELAEAIKKGAAIRVAEARKEGYGGFFARNSLIAAHADVMLAFTYGKKGESALKSGGTKHTMTEFLARRDAAFDAPAYHFNLTDRRLYKL